MKNFIVDVLALFKKKYDANSNETGQTKFIDLPPDIKSSVNVIEPEVSLDVSKPNNFANSSAQSSQDNRNKTSKHYNDNLDDVDKLATFIISSDKSKHDIAASNRKLGRWVTGYESLNINGRTIEQGFFYFGDQLKTLVGYGTEPSLINESLLVSPPKAIHSISNIHIDESLGYWPSYEALSSLCRGAYLDWLASDRAHPDTPIGYVFIYFGGFERRVIESINDDSVSDDEFIAIYNEVLRLHNIYGKQSSFNNYSAHFLEFMTLVRSPLFEKKIQTAQLLPPPDSSQSLKFKMRLAKIVTLKLPVPATLAWEWLVFSNEYNFKTPAKRCEEKFKDLFDITYHKTYPNGFIVPPNKTKLKISYHAASRSIVSIDLTLDDLQDPSVLKSPIKKLIAIAEQCNDSLDAYSRYLGRDDNSETDIDAIMLLPTVLIQQQYYQEKYPVIQKFKAWAESVTQNDEGLATTKELWAHLDALPKSLPKSFTKKHNELIANLAELAGFGIVPDQRYHQTSLEPDGYVVLFGGSHGQDFEPSASFYQISLALRLGAMVATINGYVDTREVDTLLTIIEQDTQLTTIEKVSLKAYLLWRLNSSSNMAGLKAKLAMLDEKHINFISRFIISVALADGNVEPSQIKQLEKLYQALGLDKNSVVSDIHHLTSTKRVMTNFSDATQQKSTNDNNVGANVDSSDHNIKPFIFDTELLASYESETGDAKAMLASIFAADDDDMEADSDSLLNELVDNHIDVEAVNESVAKGLDNIHSKLYQQLISKEVWQREEAEVLCESLNLMINGAIETINDWAYDNVDAPVLEDENEVVIDFEIVEELKALD